ncbi:hypothetical protein [Methylobacterium sp. CM6247]
MEAHQIWDASIYRGRPLSEERTRAFTLQLRSLLDCEDDFVEAGIQPSLASFEGLADLMRVNPGMRHPNISIDMQGRFVASWVPYPRAKLALTFAGPSDGTWVGLDLRGQTRDREFGLFRVDDTSGIPNRFACWMIATEPR